MRARPFWTLLVLISVGAYLVRVVYILDIARHQQLGGDALTFHLLANLLGDGRGFISPQQLVFRGIVEPTAEHPPLYQIGSGHVSRCHLADEPQRRADKHEPLVATLTGERSGSR